MSRHSPTLQPITRAAWMLGAAFLPAAALAAQHDAEPVLVEKRVLLEEGGRWYRLVHGERFLVDPEVVSLRLQPEVADLAQLLATAGVPALELVRVNMLGIHDLRITDGTDVIAALAAIRATGLVEFAEENPRGRYANTPDDPNFRTQWALQNTGQNGGTPGADIGAPGAWSISVGHPSIVVAVIDSGVEIGHPDLAANIWINAGEIPGNGIDDEHNGFIDDVNGWNFVHMSNDPTSPAFHGTAVAGVVGAVTNNGLGVAGLAGGFGDPSQGCRLMPLAIGDLAPEAALLDDAIIYAANNGARVITLSLFVPQTTAIDLALAYAWNAKGVFINCASGNQGGPVNYPARNPHVVSVAASDSDDLVPSWSNSGPENWVTAPGLDIATTTLNGGYTSQSGTSYAAPYVAGLAALIYSVLPNTANTSVKEILRLTAVDLGPPGFDEDAGWGRIDAHAALLEASRRDCNQNGVYDPEDIAMGTSADTDADGIPDECGCIAPASFCIAAPNSVGNGALLGASGTGSVALDDLVLDAAGLPAGANALFFYGPAAIQLPFGEGFRCVGGGTSRLASVITSGNGDAQHALRISTAMGPAGSISPGDLVHFQLWYADPLGGPAGFNLTNGLTVGFCP